MQSARIRNPKELLFIEKLHKPKLGHGHQVFVKMAACGLCHNGGLYLINGGWKDTILLGLPMQASILSVDLIIKSDIKLFAYWYSSY